MVNNGGIRHDIHGVRMTEALCIAGSCYPPNVVKRVRGGIYYYSSYWMDTDFALTWSGIVSYRKLRRILRKHKVFLDKKVEEDLVLKNMLERERRYG